jgi:hypothetical protein
MQIIPTVDGQNLSRCLAVIRVIRGFVGIIGVKISKDNNHLQDLIKLFNKQTTELELFIEGDNYDERLKQIVTAHSDVNIGKVYFYNNNVDTVEQDTTNIRIFGIQPGIIVNQENYSKLAVINKFEYGVVNTLQDEKYLEYYKYLKSNDFKGSLFLDFDTNKIPDEILKSSDIDGVYFDITQNPHIKDTISIYRRTANSIY